MTVELSLVVCRGFVARVPCPNAVLVVAAVRRHGVVVSPAYNCVTILAVYTRHTPTTTNRIYKAAGAGFTQLRYHAELISTKYSKI